MSAPITELPHDEIKSSLSRTPPNPLHHHVRSRSSPNRPQSSSTTSSSTLEPNSLSLSQHLPRRIRRISLRRTCPYFSSIYWLRVGHVDIEDVEDGPSLQLDASAARPIKHIVLQNAQEFFFQTIQAPIDLQSGQSRSLFASSIFGCHGDES